MGILTIALVSLLGILFAYTKNLEWFLYLFLFTLFCLPLLLNWFGAYQYQGFIPIFLIAVLAFFYYPELIRSSIFKSLMFKMVLVIFALSTLILVFSAINDYDFIKGVLFFRNYLWAYILFAILVSIRIPQIDIKRVFLYIFLSQLILVIVQYVGGSTMNQMFLLLEYEKDGKMQVATSTSVLEQSEETGGLLLVGSLGKITKLANYLSFFVTFWIGYIMSKQMKLKIVDVLVIITSIGIIVLTGTRSPLASAVIGCILAYLFVHRTRKKTSRFLLLCMLFFIIAVPTLLAVGNTALEERANYGNTIQRSLSLFGFLANLENLDANNVATLGRSIYLFQFIDYQTVLCGTGIFTNNPLGYGPGISSITDCMIVFIIAEYGILVLTLCFIPYGIALSHVKRRCSKDLFKTVLILFIVVFMQTIVDQGMFDMLNLYCFYIICALLINMQKNSEKASLPLRESKVCIVQPNI